MPRSERHCNRGDAKRLVSFEGADRNSTVIGELQPPVPNRPGVHVRKLSAGGTGQCIDWTPFFQAWELAGKYPAILTDEIVGPQASDLYRDARTMLAKIVDEKWLTAKAVFGLWPANSTGDDVELQVDGNTERLHFLRQQVDKPADRPDFCLADFIAPKESGRQDWIGMFAVTAGIGIDEHGARFEADHDDYNAILLKALADRLAEALAERLHQRVRAEFWGYVADESLDNEALIEKYIGIRPAPGYPACPEHSEKATLFRLLDAGSSAGMSLTESFAMLHRRGVRLLLQPPEEPYFVVGRVSKEQWPITLSARAWMWRRWNGGLPRTSTTIGLNPRGSVIRDTEATALALQSRRSAHHVEHLVAGTHGVVIGLAGGAFLVVVLAIVGVENPIPGTMRVVDEVFPRIRPQLVVPAPVGVIAGAGGQQRGGRQRFGLHPEILVVVADGAVGREAVVQAAPLRIP